MADSQNCPDWVVMMHGYLDGELDAVHSLKFEQHLESCDNCSKQLEKAQRLRQVIGQDGVSWRMPAEVREQVLATAAQQATYAYHNGKTSAFANWLNFLKRWSYIPSLAGIAASLFSRTLPAAPGGIASEPTCCKSCQVAARQSSDRCANVRSAHRQTLVQWKD